VAVQVAGSAAAAGVDEGMKTWAIGVDGGKGLKGLVGFEKIDPNASINNTTPRTKKIERTSQSEVFIYVSLEKPIY
jgi:hypothetical protein